MTGSYTSSQKTIERAPRSDIKDYAAPPGVMVLYWLTWTSVALIGSLIALEVLFHLANVGQEDYGAPDPTLGGIHLNNKAITYRSEGYSQSYLNSQGFRDKEYCPSKPPGVTRIVVLGDSKVAGFEVSPESTFPKVMERQLNHKTPGRFEVLNCGISGFSTGQEYLLFLKRLAAYHPDITILTYHIGDSDENVFGQGLVPRPYFSVGSDGKLQIDWHSVDEWLKSDKVKLTSAFDWLHRNSCCWGVLTKTSINLTNNKTYGLICKFVGKPLSQLYSCFLVRLPNFDCSDCSRDTYVALSRRMGNSKCVTVSSTTGNASMVDHQTDKTSEYQMYLNATMSRWSITAEIIRQLHQACHDINSRLVVAALPAPNNSVFYCRELKELSRLAKQQGFTFIDLNAAFPSYAPMEKTPYYIAIHFSKAGHKLAAQTILDSLRDVQLANH